MPMFHSRGDTENRSCVLAQTETIPPQWNYTTAAPGKEQDYFGKGKDAFFTSATAWGLEQWAEVNPTRNAE